MAFQFTSRVPGHHRPPPPPHQPQWPHVRQPAHPPLPPAPVLSPRPPTGAPAVDSLQRPPSDVVEQLVRAVTHGDAATVQRLVTTAPFAIDYAFASYSPSPLELLITSLRHNRDPSAHLSVLKQLLPRWSAALLRSSATNGRTLLHQAVAEDVDLRVITLLVQSGLLLSHADVIGRTPIFEILSPTVKSPVRVMRHLLTHGKEVAGWRDKQGCTVLHVACAHRKVNAAVVVREVLKQAPKIGDSTDIWLRTPLMYACMGVIRGDRDLLPIYPTPDVISEIIGVLHTALTAAAGSLQNLSQIGPADATCAAAATELISVLLPNSHIIAQDRYGLVSTVQDGFGLTALHYAVIGLRREKGPIEQLLSSVPQPLLPRNLPLLAALWGNVHLLPLLAARGVGPVLGTTAVHDLIASAIKALQGLAQNQKLQPLAFVKEVPLPWRPAGSPAPMNSGVVVDTAKRKSEWIEPMPTAAGPTTGAGGDATKKGRISPCLVAHQQPPATVIASSSSPVPTPVSPLSAHARMPASSTYSPKRPHHTSSAVPSPRSNTMAQRTSSSAVAATQPEEDAVENIEPAPSVSSSSSSPPTDARAAVKVEVARLKAQQHREEEQQRVDKGNAEVMSAKKELTSQVEDLRKQVDDKSRELSVVQSSMLKMDDQLESIRRDYDARIRILESDLKAEKSAKARAEVAAEAALTELQKVQKQLQGPMVTREELQKQTKELEARAKRNLAEKEYKIEKLKESMEELDDLYRDVRDDLRKANKTHSKKLKELMEVCGVRDIAAVEKALSEWAAARTSGSSVTSASASGHSPSGERESGTRGGHGGGGGGGDNDSSRRVTDLEKEVTRLKDVVSARDKQIRGLKTALDLQHDVIDVDAKLAAAKSQEKAAPVPQHVATRDASPSSRNIGAPSVPHASSNGATSATTLPRSVSVDEGSESVEMDALRAQLRDASQKLMRMEAALKDCGLKSVDELQQKLKGMQEGSGDLAKISMQLTIAKANAKMYEKLAQERASELAELRELKMLDEKAWVEERANMHVMMSRGQTERGLLEIANIGHKVEMEKLAEQVKHLKETADVGPKIAESEKLADQVKQLKAERDKLADQVKALKSSDEARAKDVRELSHKLRGAGCGGSDARRVRDLEQKLRKAEDDNARLDERVRVLEEDQRRVVHVMDDVWGVRDVRQLVSRIADLKGKCDLAEARVKDATKQCEALMHERSEAQDARKAAEAALSAAGDHMRSLEEQKAQLQKDCDEARTDLGVLQGWMVAVRTEAGMESMQAMEGILDLAREYKRRGGVLCAETEDSAKKLQELQEKVVRLEQELHTRETADEGVEGFKRQIKALEDKVTELQAEVDYHESEAAGMSTKYFELLTEHNEAKNYLLNDLDKELQSVVPTKTFCEASRAEVADALAKNEALLEPKTKRAKKPVVDQAEKLLDRLLRDSRFDPFERQHGRLVRVIEEHPELKRIESKYGKAAKDLLLEKRREIEEHCASGHYPVKLFWNEGKLLKIGEAIEHVVKALLARQNPQPTLKAGGTDSRLRSTSVAATS